MRLKSGPPETAEQHIKSIRRATRKKYSTEEKIRIVLSGLRGEPDRMPLSPKSAQPADGG